MTSTQAQDSGTAMRETFVRGMRRVANSVTVVTTDGPGGRCGATVSSFCSVSADPPSTLVCLKADSRIADAVAGNGGFCINILPTAFQDIADRFAGKLDHNLADRFDGLELESGHGMGPIISGSTAFSCSVRQSIAFETHRVFIAHVVGVEEGTSDPLAYLDGSYHNVSPKQAEIRAVTGNDAKGDCSAK